MDVFNFYVIADDFDVIGLISNHNQKHFNCQVGLILTRDLLWCGWCFRLQQI